MPENELKLLPCPMCGKGDVETLEEWSGSVLVSYGIGCICGCQIDTVWKNKESAIKVWNTRAKDPEKEALIALLKEAYFAIIRDKTSVKKAALKKIEAALKSVRDV
jgi:hypothetical protein